MEKTELYTISVLVENHFGVLSKVSGLFSARGFNIKSLSVGETKDPTISRMTIVVEASGRILEQVKKQLNKLVDVIKIIDMTSRASIERELMILKVETTEGKRAEIFTVVNAFRAKVVDISQKDISIEITGNIDKVNAFVAIMRPYGIKELARTGKVAIERGKK